MNRCDTRYASRDTQRERERERERHTHKEIDKERDTAHFVSAISFFLSSCPSGVCVRGYGQVGGFVGGSVSWWGGVCGCWLLLDGWLCERKRDRKR